MVEIGVVIAEDAMDWGFFWCYVRMIWVAWDLRNFCPYDVYDRMVFDLADELGAGVLDWVGELDGTGDGDAVVDDLGVAELLLKHNVAACVGCPSPYCLALLIFNMGIKGLEPLRPSEDQRILNIKYMVELLSAYYCW